jgi:FKBP-type peptidyl-prolyl cis-trans isomerase 2
MTTTTTDAVKTGDVIQVHYVGTITDTGEEFDSSYGREAPFQFKVGAGMVIGGFDAAVQGMVVGDKKTISLTPAQAYGQRNPEALLDFETSNFPEEFDVKVGALVPLTGPNGPTVALIHEIKEDVVVLDMNHRLAGKDLSFDLELIGIGMVDAEEPAASEEEEAEAEGTEEDED